ncbi:MAG: riboflavin kinase, partial [Planctomycetota bacterium]|nr:riboflavin kinase [Planctomycetota bacterium]
FGHRRSGTTTLLHDLGAQFGFEVFVLEDVQFNGERVSSSRIRAALAEADLELANSLLGRPYEILGRVRAGQRRGRLLGTPTANLHPQTMLPADGVYVTSSRLPGGRFVPSVSFVGTNPTFGQEARKCETHVLSNSEAVPDGAGWPLQVAFQARVRAAVRFKSPEALQHLIHQDLEVARQHHADRR